MTSLSQLTRTLCAMALLTGLVTFMGCSTSTVGGNPVEVTGTVSVGGAPLSVGVVEFQSNDNEEIHRLIRVTAGKFSVDETQGLIEGDYSVRILPFEPEVEELSELTPAERQEILNSRKLIPQQYQQAGALSASLSAEQPNVVTFDLKS